MLFCNFHRIILFTVPKSTYPNVYVSERGIVSSKRAMLTAWIPLTLSLLSLSFAIRIFRLLLFVSPLEGIQYPLRDAECKFFAGLQTLESISSSLVSQQYPACYARLHWIVFLKAGGKLCWLVGWCFQDLFKIALSIIVKLLPCFLSSLRSTIL